MLVKLRRYQQDYWPRLGIFSIVPAKQGYQEFKMSKEIIEIFRPMKIFQFHMHIEFAVG